MKLENAKIRNTKGLIEKANTGMKPINIFNSTNKGEFYYIDVDQLIPFKNQARAFLNDKKIEDLAESIKKYGIRQPLTIIPSLAKERKYEIISGERRYRAAIIAGFKKIPCIILLEAELADEVAIIENIKRKDLHPVELGKAYNILNKKEKFNTHEKIATMLGVSRTQVTEYLNLAKLSSNIKKVIIEKNITDRATLRKILKEKTEHDQISVINQIKNKDHKNNISNKQSILQIYVENQKIIIKNNTKLISDNLKKELYKKIKEIL